MNRRGALCALLALAAAQRASYALQQGKAWRIGYLSPGSGPGMQDDWRNALKRAGYEEGKNIAIERRFAEGNAARLIALADELVRLDVELIVAYLNDASDAARRATKTKPIVMFANMFPAERGMITSLAHPGGNVTGTVWWANPNVTRLKMLQIVKDAVPKARRVCWLTNMNESQYRFYDVPELYRSAAAIGLTVQMVGLSNIAELKPALDRVAAIRPDALFVGGALSTFGAFPQIAAFAIQRKLVSLSDGSSFVSAGGLLSYGPDIRALVDRTVSYIDRILQGAKPGDLPVEQSAKWNFVLNAKTARAIGFKPSTTFMAGVDKQVE